MRSVNFPGVVFGVVGLCALSGAVWGQGYPEWGGGYPGWGGAYPYPYAPSYGYGSAYAPGYPPLEDYPPGQAPGTLYPGDTQPGGAAIRSESPLDPGMVDLSKEEQAAAAAQRAAAEARYAERLRAMEQRRLALRAAIEKRLAETSTTEQPSDVQEQFVPMNSTMDYRTTAAELRREMQARQQERRAAAEARSASSAAGYRQPYGLGLGPQAGASPEDAAVTSTVPPSGEYLEPGSGDADPGDLPGSRERLRAPGDRPDMGLGFARHPSLSERRAALEVRRQVIQQRREAMKAAFEERRRAALATTPGERPAAGAVPPPSVVEESGSGDADRGDLERGVEKRRAADEPAPMGLGLPAPETTATPPEG